MKVWREELTGRHRSRGRIQPVNMRKYRRNKRLIGTVSSSDGGDRKKKKKLPNPLDSLAESCVFLMLFVT